jgi:hypothetical protein
VPSTRSSPSSTSTTRYDRSRPVLEIDLVSDGDNSVNFDFYIFIVCSAIFFLQLCFINRVTLHIYFLHMYVCKPIGAAKTLPLRFFIHRIYVFMMS